MSDNFPLIYQTVDLSVDMIDASIKGSTTLWMAFKESDTVKSMDVINLHCRKCQISKVEVNGIDAKFTHIDPLSSSLSNDFSQASSSTTVSSSQPQTSSSIQTQSESFLAEELDIMYRSALEITRRGELQISIPENISVCKAKLPEFPSKLKRSSKMADVSSRVDKISKIVSMLKDTYFDADPSNIAPFPKLFTVKIDYVITSAPKEGIIFRKRAGTDTVSVLSTSHSNRNTSNTEYVEDKECACVYTLSQGVTGTLDPHGVRCWLPCFDHPSQRPAFDLTLTAPSHMAFTCTGRLISSTTHESVTKSATMRTNRYFTVNRIPTRAVGFFIGLSEQYSIPLYRTVGHTWVARGLMDYIPTRGQVLPARVSKTASIHQSQNGTNMNKKARLDSSIENRNPNNSESNDIMKSDEVAVTEVEIEGEVEVVEEVEDNDILKAEQNLCGGRLYREHVRHSTLGLDLAMRLIHKHTQRRYEHPQYTQIFVHGLEEDFLSFDGFSLIDARFLISSEQVAQESTSHLQQVRAYLSAWLTNGSTLPINAIDCEFILQGIVESLLVDYCDSVFGEDASMYRHQKAIDSVVNLEKSGFSFSLSEPYFPESYDRFTPYFRQYFENKSLAVFQMINTRLGGRAIMRTVYQSLIKSPPLYAPSGSAHFPGYHSRHARGASDLNSGSMNQYMANEQFGTSLMYLGLVPSPGHSNSDPGTPHYDRYSDGIMSPAYPYMNPSSPSLDSYPQSPYAYGSGASPNPYAAASMSPNPYGTPYMPSSSPNPYGAPYIPSQSPNPYAAPYMPSQSPNPYGVPYLLPGDSASPRPRSRSNSFDFPTIRPRSSSVDSTGAYLQVPSHALKAPDSFPVPASINPSALKRQNTVTSETSGGMTSMGEQVSEGTIISLDTFISSIQLISGTDSDLDDNFLDTYICNSGCQLIRFGVFVGIKIEGRPQMMTIVADSILLKGGKIIQDVPAEDLQRSDIRLRICELRDDTVTEPMMKLTAGIEVPYQQQLFTRPGRKGGRPRKSQGGEDGMPSSLSLLHSTAESLKDPLEIARDREEAVRYALIDPQFSYIIGEVNIISSDAALVEQLYAEVDKFDLLRHIQALRSLARVAPLSYPLSVAANSTRLNPSSLESSKYALKLKAMADCLLCISLANNPQKTISSGHSMYVRMEAAFALAHWQNEHAPSYVNAADAITLGGPDTVVNPITENLDDLDEGWIGLKHLLEATHELYLDNSTLLPTSCDLTDEQQMQLRCTVLQAISTIRSTNGLTPPKVVNTLLLFTEFHMNQPVPYVPPASHDINDEDVTHRKAVSDTRHTRSSSSNGTSRRTNAMTKETLYLYDDSHYVATLMLTLRNMRFDSHNKRNPTDPLFRVCDQAVKCLKTDLAIAKAKARVARNPESEGDFFLPVLPLSGAVSASALACIGEMDSQLVTIVDKDKDRKQTGNFQFIVLGCVQFVLRVPGGGEKLMVGPTGTGSLSSIRYTDFFVAEGAKLAFTQVPQQAQDLDHDSSAGSRVTSRDFSLYPPSVRLCALEAFIRLCLTQASLLSEKIKIFRNSPEAHAQAQTQAQAQAQGLKPTAPKISPPHPVFIPAIIEAVLYVVNNDTDRRTRRGAALTFLECMQDRPSGRAAMEALASGDSWSFIGHSDREALTRFESSTYYIARPGTRKLSGASVYRDLFAHADGPQARQMVRNWWNCIAQHSDEVVRSLLLRAWIYVFGATAPLCMTIGDKKKQADMIAQVAELKGKLWGAEAAHLLPDRLSVRAPSECFRISEMAIRHGRLYKPVVFSQASPPPRPVLVSSSSSARPPQPPLTISTSSHALPSTSAVASAASSSVAGSGLRLSLSIPKDQPK